MANLKPPKKFREVKYRRCENCVFRQVDEDSEMSCQRDPQGNIVEWGNYTEIYTTVCDYHKYDK